MKVKQFSFLFSFLVFFTISSQPAFSFQNEPDGFCGIKWGTDISEVPEMVLVTQKVIEG